MGRKKVRILIVDDEASIRQGVRTCLEHEGYVVRARPDGTDITGIAEEFDPDLAILDIRLPVGPDGYEIGRTLRKGTDLPILFLTAADRVADRVEGLGIGDDYLVKPYAIAELRARVKALLRRSGRLRRDVWEVGGLVVDDHSRTVTSGETSLQLTSTEYELLSALAKHPGQVLSKSQLLSWVWGFDAYDVNLVEVHVSALRRKLNALGPQMVHTVYGAGYVLRP